MKLIGKKVNEWNGEGEDGREWGIGELMLRIERIKGIESMR